MLLQQNLQSKVRNEFPVAEQREPVGGVSALDLTGGERPFETIGTDFFLPHCYYLLILANTYNFIIIIVI